MATTTTTKHPKTTTKRTEPRLHVQQNFPGQQPPPTTTGRPRPRPRFSTPSPPPDRQLPRSGLGRVNMFSTLSPATKSYNRDSASPVSAFHYLQPREAGRADNNPFPTTTGSGRTCLRFRHSFPAKKPTTTTDSAVFTCSAPFPRHQTDRTALYLHT